MAVIAIAGGIGSGKSVVSKIISALGYHVYDCDIEAKRIMDNSPEIKSFIRDNICEEAILKDGSINRTILGEVVFKSPHKLELLNAVVHDVVKTDLQDWARDKSLAFVESAILYQSGIDKLVDMVWEVTAPEEIRLARVIKRNNLSAEQVRDRIKSQDRFIVTDKHPATIIIDNDGMNPVLPVILNLLSNLQK